MQPIARPPTRTILGMRVDATTYNDASDRILARAVRSESGYVCVSNVHMAMEAFDDPEFRAVVNGAHLVTPDGMPLVWGLRLRGVRHAERVYGPTLTLILCAKAAAQGIPVGFYGGSERVLHRMRSALRERFPDLDVAYAWSPPFRPLEPEEDERITAELRESGARLIFIGLGCPKQEWWMAAHRDRLPAMLIGVGAAFDFIAGEKRQAPRLMQAAGLEWFFRLATEPRRLWRRYLCHNPRFLVHFVREQLVGRDLHRIWADGTDGTDGTAAVPFDAVRRPGDDAS